jgi:hypothetical protein
MFFSGMSEISLNIYIYIYIYIYIQDVGVRIDQSL